MKLLNVSLWQIYSVKRVEIRQVTRKYPSEIKYYLCHQDSSPNGILFDYTEVKEI